MTKSIVIYTDGACLGNPGPGGYGAVLIYGTNRKEISGGFRRTTNNRMELTAAIEALVLLKEPCEVTLYSDSRYLVDAMTLGWARSWQARGWRRKDGPVPNSDLWERMLDLCRLHHIQFVWVEGHAGNPDNERCDRLSVKAAMEGKRLPADEGYEDVKAVVEKNKHGNLLPLE